MANDLTNNPWIIDTAAATDLANGQNVRVEGIRWVGATTAGHGCIIKNAAGKVMWESVASGAGNYVEADRFPVKTWIGLAVTTLTSGKVYIELG